MRASPVLSYAVKVALALAATPLVRPLLRPRQPGQWPTAPRTTRLTEDVSPRAPATPGHAGLERDGHVSPAAVKGTQRHVPLDDPRQTGSLPDSDLSHLRFALVIPALNEEDAIALTLERALKARQYVEKETGIGQMLVVFVNDGSSDDTQTIADRYPEVIKVRFDENRGYGAAIKAGFQATDAEIVGFMDADGTCDPFFCAQLIRHMQLTEADVVLGARMEADSQMPRVRRLGNWIFARLVGIISGQSLTDCASGMRVIRRSMLRMMVPLPDGLHFTPAMSCLALLDSRIRIAELPMPYRERVGRSKLRLMTDGVKFLGIILFAASCFNPIRVLSTLGVFVALAGIGLGSAAAAQGADPWAWTLVAGAGTFVLLQAAFIGMLCHQLMFMLIRPRAMLGRGERTLQAVFKAKPMVLAGAALGMIAGSLSVLAIVGPPAWRGGLLVAAGVCGASGGWTALGGIMLREIWAVARRQEAANLDPFAIGVPHNRADRSCSEG